MIVQIEAESEEKICTFCGARGNMKVRFDKFKKLVYVCHEVISCRKRLMSRLRGNTVKVK